MMLKSLHEVVLGSISYESIRPPLVEVAKSWVCKNLEDHLGESTLVRPPNS